MQERIEAIKQLLDTNIAIASVIEFILIDSIGEKASWQNSSHIQELRDESSSVEIHPQTVISMLQKLWRSRIHLNNARANAENINLDDFLAEACLDGMAIQRLESLIEARNAEIGNLKLALDAAKKPTDDLLMECDQLRRDFRERDREVERLKADINAILVSHHANPLDRIQEQNAIEPDLVPLANELRAALDLVKERDRVIDAQNVEINRLKGWLKKREDQLQEIHKKKPSEALEIKIDDLTACLNVSHDTIADRNRQIEELQINVKNHREQFESLKLHFEITLKAIAMNLNALKGARKPDETKEVNGVMTTFRNYDDNLTHHHKTIIIENVQRAIAEEAKKLKSVNLKDFSFDDIPF